VILIPEIPQDDETSNPLLAIKQQSNILPRLGNVTDLQVYNGLGKALLDFETAVVHAETMAEEGVRDLHAILGPLEVARAQYESVWHVANMLQLVTDSLERDRFVRLHIRAEKASLSRVDSKPLYEALREIKAKYVEDGEKGLSEDDVRLLDRYLLEYRNAGHHLETNKYLELTETWLPRLNNPMAEYKFRQKSATERFRHVISNPDVVRDFPVDVLKAMASDSSQPTRGPWSVSLHPYIYKQVMAYCPDRSVRWTTHLGDVMRGSKDIDPNLGTASHARDIRKHRSDQALTLGYKHFGEYSMQTKMAANVDNVHAMISNLKTDAKSRQEQELEDLQNFAESRGFEEEIEVYDVAFYKRKKRRAILGVSDEELRDFFPLPKVLDGLFHLSAKLFSVGFEEIKDVNMSEHAWHSDVKLYRAIDLTPGAGNAELGRFFMDPFIRDDKGYSGGDKGWYIPMRQPSRQRPDQALGSLVFSLPMPNYGKPSLLSLNEVEEVFRNFGNMLFHMVSNQTDWSSLSYKGGLEWDVLDLPSVFMQHWLYIPEVVSSLSGHWSTNQPLDRELVEKLCTVPRQLLAGYDLCNELFLAAYDINFYTVDWGQEQYQDMVHRIRPDFLLLPAVSRDHFPLYVSDMFCGDYPAAMFTKVWAKMLAADAFSAVQEARSNGETSLFEDERVKKVTMRYRNTVLGQGSALPASDIFRQFRGRDPTHEALLHSLGLKDTHQPKKRGQEE